ncbi:MAG: alkaline phosphatase family protein [Calditrichaeota bacterium]|nr:alkaline phosphatase family protein [Calditrichota bacterium]
MTRKIFTLALDGTPYTFLKKMIGQGKMPQLAELVKNADFKPMDSVIPPVSSTAWASFLTGALPEKHGILSFTEYDPVTMDWYTPDARHLKAHTLLQELSQKGKRVFSMNVPVTYPPVPVNGISICGFLGNDITGGTYPAHEGFFLQQQGYRIDADTAIAKTNLAAFLQDLKSVLEKRIEMMWHYFNREKWDFFMTHIMETDRLHHFTWGFMEKGLVEAIDLYDRFYSRLDTLIGQIKERLDDDTEFMLLSDHGFTTLKKEVYLNNWLWQKGYLKFTRPIPETLHDIHPQSRAFALYPGRIFINLKGRERSGSVEPGLEYERLLENLRLELRALKDPQDNQPIIKEVLSKDQIYPDAPANRSLQFADLVALAHDGYDLKGQLWNRHLTAKTVFNGMHTLENAFVIMTGEHFAEEKIKISDLKKYIFKILGI